MFINITKSSVTNEIILLRYLGEDIAISVGFSGSESRLPWKEPYQSGNRSSRSGTSRSGRWSGGSVRSVSKSCPTLGDPMDCSTPGYPVLHCLPELAQTHVHRVSDAIQPSHPPLPPSPPALDLSQHQGLFQWVSSSHQVARVLELHLQHQSFQWIFRIDFFLDWLVWSPCSPRDSQESSSTPQIKSFSSSVLSFLYGPALTIKK